MKGRFVVESRSKNQKVVMLILLFIMLNVDLLKIYDVEEENVSTLVTYANKFEKANIVADTKEIVNNVTSATEAKAEEERIKALKAEEEKKKAEEEKRKTMEAKSKSNLTYAEDNVGTNTNISLANEIVNYAKQFVGNPYVYGGNSLTTGTDCSGFTSLVFANFGISLPRTANSQGYVGAYVNPENRQIGDLVLYGYDGYVTHASIYIGNNQVVHALNSNTGIVITNYDIMPVVTVRRVL